LRWRWLEVEPKRSGRLKKQLHHFDHYSDFLLYINLCIILSVQYLKFWRLTDPFNSKVASSEKQIQLKIWYFPSYRLIISSQNSILLSKSSSDSSWTSHFIRVVIMFFQNGTIVEKLKILCRKSDEKRRISQIFFNYTRKTRRTIVHTIRIDSLSSWLLVDN